MKNPHEFGSIAWALHWAKNSSERVFPQIDKYKIRGSRKMRKFMREMRDTGKYYLIKTCKEMFELGLIPHAGDDERKTIWCPGLNFNNQFDFEPIKSIGPGK